MLNFDFKSNEVGIYILSQNPFTLESPNKDLFKSENQNIDYSGEYYMIISNPIFGNWILRFPNSQTSIIINYQG